LSEVEAYRPKRPKTGGRKAGVPNKTTAQLKDMILGALDAAGGMEYLQRQADESPGAFLSLIGKVLPTTLAGEGSSGGIKSISVKFGRD
jgi:hypothetical protein